MSRLDNAGFFASVRFRENLENEEIAHNILNYMKPVHIYIDMIKKRKKVKKSVDPYLLLLWRVLLIHWMKS